MAESSDWRLRRYGERLSAIAHAITPHGYALCGEPARNWAEPGEAGYVRCAGCDRLVQERQGQTVG